MILTKSMPYTHIDIWQPRYSSKYSDEKEYVVLVAKYRVDYGAPHLIVTFSKAPHLLGLRFYISRAKAQQFRIGDNGKIPCYCIPLSKFENIDTEQEVVKIAEELFP